MQSRSRSARLEGTLFSRQETAPRARWAFALPLVVGLVALVPRGAFGALASGLAQSESGQSGLAQSGLAQSAEPQPARPAAEAAQSANGAAPSKQALDGLLDAFRKSPGVSARFTEEKHIALLKKPLTSQGSLYFLSPDKLARHVESPKRSVVLLEGNELRISDGKGVRTVDLTKNAAIAALVRSFVHLLHGDRAALERDFHVDFSDRGESWLLRLTPKAAPLDKLVDVISVSGQGLVLREMAVMEPSGDRTLTRFSEVNTARRFSDEEKKRLFTL